MRIRPCALAAIALLPTWLSCGGKADIAVGGTKKAMEELRILAEMPFDFSEIDGVPMSMVRQLEGRGYRYFLNQDEDLDKAVGDYVFSVFGQAHENPEFGNCVTILITKKDCHLFCRRAHDSCALGSQDRLPFILSLANAEIWPDAPEVNPDWLSAWESHLAKNLLWQLADRKIFIWKDSADFVIKIFLRDAPREGRNQNGGSH